MSEKDHIDFSNGTFYNTVTGKRVENHYHYHGHATEIPEPESKPVAQLNPLELGVHRADRPPGPVNVLEATTLLPPYLLRDHDWKLRQELTRVRKGEGSVFAVLVGDSSTGKTRALYEALMAETPNWPLLQPQDAHELSQLLAKGRIASGMVLWLNETQQYLAGEAGATAAGLLRRLLLRTPGIVAVGALWEYPYLRELTEPGRSPDTHAAARAVLTNTLITRRFRIPDHLTDAQQRELRVLAESGGREDRRLLDALTAGAADGRVIQHMTGGPELLDAYQNGGLFRPEEHALITAALDARRLGHQAAFPQTLLATAADGYLSARQRPRNPSWALSALTALAEGERINDDRTRSRTDIRRTLTALVELRARSGTPECAYEVNDYLDQSSRSARSGILGPAALWDALAEGAEKPEDLKRLAWAAWDRGLYRRGAILHKKAILAAGDPHAAVQLISKLEEINHINLEEAAAWAVAHTQVGGDPYLVGWLLDVLHKAGLTEAREALCHRIADELPLTEQSSFQEPLRRLRGVGAKTSVDALAHRAAAELPLKDMQAVSALLQELQSMELTEASDALLNRRLVHSVSMEDTPPGHLHELLQTLRSVGAGKAADDLALRAAVEFPLKYPSSVTFLLRYLRDVAGAVDALMARDPVGEVGIEDAFGIGMLLEELQRANMTTAVNALVQRNPAEHSNLPDTFHVGVLLKALRGVGATEAADALALRAAKEFSPDDSRNVHWLLPELRENGTGEAVDTFVHRIAENFPVAERYALEGVCKEVKRIGTAEPMRILAHRIATDFPLDAEHSLHEPLNALRKMGATAEMKALAVRAAADFPLGNTQAGTVASLLDALAHSEMRQAAHILLRRQPALRVLLDDARGVGRLLGTLRELGMSQSVTGLLERDPAERILLTPDGVDNLLWELRRTKDKKAAAKALSVLCERAACHLPLNDPWAVSSLLSTLRILDESDALTTLAHRIPDEMDLNAPVRIWGVSKLLEELQEIEVPGVADSFALRVATHVPLHNHRDIKGLLRDLRRRGFRIAAQSLADRVADHISLQDVKEITDLHQCLRETGYPKAANVLARRSADAGMFSLFLAFETPTTVERFRHGREPDGAPTAAWTWSDLP